jgi:hypothetical protein
MYCSGKQPDIVERLRETSAEIVKDTLPRWKNLDEYMDEAADEIERLQKELKTERVLSFRNQVLRLEEQLAEIAAERNRVWWHEHWTEYEYNIARTEREACIDCIKAFSTVEDRAEEMIAAIRARGGNEI